MFLKVHLTLLFSVAIQRAANPPDSPPDIAYLRGNIRWHDRARAAHASDGPPRTAYLSGNIG